MHSLVGCYLDQTSERIQVGGETFMKLILRLSPKIKRVFFFKDEVCKSIWTALLTEAIGTVSPNIKEHYSISSVLLGQGSFGKVFKGTCKHTL
jgi:dTDP-4-dehydrorhamnose reductase